MAYAVGSSGETESSPEVYESWMLGRPKSRREAQLLETQAARVTLCQRCQCGAIANSGDALYPSRSSRRGGNPVLLPVEATVPLNPVELLQKPWRDPMAVSSSSGDSDGRPSDSASALPAPAPPPLAENRDRSRPSSQLTPARGRGSSQAAPARVVDTPVKSRAGQAGAVDTKPSSAAGVTVRDNQCAAAASGVRENPQAASAGVKVKSDLGHGLARNGAGAPGGPPALSRDRSKKPRASKPSVRFNLPPEKEEEDESHGVRDITAGVRNLSRPPPSRPISGTWVPVAQVWVNICQSPCRPANSSNLQAEAPGRRDVDWVVLYMYTILVHSLPSFVVAVVVSVSSQTYIGDHRLHDVMRYAVRPRLLENFRHSERQQNKVHVYFVSTVQGNAMFQPLSQLYTTRNHHPLPVCLCVLSIYPSI